MLKIGYAQNVITPSLERPVFLAGFGHDRRAVDVHDDLYARALAIQEGETTLVLCALDLIGFFSIHAQEVIGRLQEKHPGVQMVIASTHTHHGPDTMGLWGPNMRTSGVDWWYMSFLKDKILATLLSALEKMEEGQMKSGAVLVPGLAKNARDPEVRDEELSVAQFVDRHGCPLASLFDFPCHPEVLWEQNPRITADYPGILRREVEQASGTPCIFFSGALGGMMTPDVREHSFKEAETMGRRLAEEGLKVLAMASPAPGAAVSLQRRPIRVKLTNPLYKLGFLLKVLPDVRDRKGFIHGEVNLVKIGDLWLATVPGELLPKLGLEVKTALRKAGAGVPAVIGLANDELGYILPAEDFRYPLNPFKPGKHYEETNSVGKGIGPAVIEAIRSML